MLRDRVLSCALSRARRSASQYQELSKQKANQHAAQLRHDEPGDVRWCDTREGVTQRTCDGNRGIGERR